MSILTPGRNLVLIGLMGAGKTTVGKSLAERLQRPFVDTDELVEGEAELSIAEIFAQHGERRFRELEAMAVRRVSAVRGQVIAVGGGAVLQPANVTNLRMTGDLVLLDAPAATLAERVEGPEAGERPLLQGGQDLQERLDELRRERDADYERAADFVVDTSGKAPEEIADEVLEWAALRAGLLTIEERT